MLHRPVPDGAEQRVVPLEHRVHRATIQGEEARRLIMAIAAEAGHSQRTVAEGHDDGAVVLLGAEVLQAVAHAVARPVGDNQQYSLLQHSSRDVHVPKAHRMRGLHQHMPEERERALLRWGRLLAEGVSSMAAALEQLLLPEPVRYLGDPVVHRPQRYGSTNLPHTERVLAARLSGEELREGKGIEIIRLLGREHDGAVRARTITCNLEALHMLTKG
jgi:hypothetical protein